MLFSQYERKDSKPYHAIVSAHMFVNETGRIDIEILDYIHNDDEGTEIFNDIEYTLRDYLEFDGKDEHYFMAHVKSWFHSYYDYFDGPQCEVESEVTELKTIKDFADINFS